MARTKTVAKQKPAALAIDSQEQAGVVVSKADNKPAKHEGGMSWRKGICKYTPDQLDVKCNEYFAKCDEMGRRYTQPGLALHLDINTDTLNEWFKDKDRYNGLSVIIKKAYDRMSDAFQQENQSMALFLLKQPCYGGYADRVDNTSGGLVAINISFGQSDGKVVAEYGK